MKHLRALLAAMLLSLCAHAAVPLDWIADVSKPSVAPLACRRGETAALRCKLVRDGRPFDPAAVSASIYWQTNGMGDLWWSAPATVASNVLSAVWTPDMDPGASPVSLFIGAVDASGDRIYSPAASLRILHAPGAVPNELPLPARAIDFATVAVTNAPWALMTDMTLTDVSVPTDWVFADGLLEAAQMNIPTVSPPSELFIATRNGYVYCGIGTIGQPHDSANEFCVCQLSIDGLSAIMVNGPPWALAAIPVGGMVATRSTVPGYVLGSQTDKPLAPAGEYALKSDIDFTQENATLVATIEAVAPVPGNYAAVSNRAMNAVAKTGDTMTGNLIIDGGRLTVVDSIEGTSQWDDGRCATLYWPNFIVDYPNDGGENILTFPDKSGIFAVLHDIESATNGLLRAESDPTVKAWAKAATKPSYTPAEVGALPVNPLAGASFDFSTNAGLYLAVSNLVTALGGSVTNFPSIP